MKNIDKVITATEAAERWGIDSSSIRKAIASGRFKPDEHRKSGNVNLILYSAMVRAFGEEKVKDPN